MVKLKWTYEPGSTQWCPLYHSTSEQYRITVMVEFGAKRPYGYQLEIKGHHICTFKKLAKAKQVAQLIFDEQ